MSAKYSERWPARLFTAEFPSGLTVRVHLSDRGIVISETPDTDEIIWPYGALTADPRIDAETQTTSIHYKYMPEARLEVASPGFGPELGRHAPQVIASAWSARLFKYAVLGATAGITVWLMISLYNSQPARMVAGMIPQETRQSLGRSVIASMAGRYRICTDAAGKEALQRLTERLLGASTAATGTKVTVANWSLINAFAAPGGQLLLTNGLIQAARSPEEVAGVLAHEIGHSLELHPEAGIVRALGISVGIDLITGGGGTLSGIGNLLLNNSYVRQDERSADDQALRLLRKAKISQFGLIAFFERIGRQQGSNGEAGGGSTIGGLFRTHPYPRERAARVRRSATYHSTPAMTDGEWQALRRICSQTRPAKQG